MAVLDICHRVRAQCNSLWYFPFHLHLALYDIPGDLVGYDSSPGAVALSRDVPYGPCNDHQHDSVCLCSRLGKLGYLLGEGETLRNIKKMLTKSLGLGLVDTRRYDIRVYLFLSPFRDVSSPRCQKLLSPLK